MLRNLLCVTLTIVCFLGQSQNFNAKYNFSGVTPATGTIDPTPPPAAAGVTCYPFTAAGTHTTPNASGRFSFINWPLGGIDQVDNHSAFTGTLSPNAYYEVTLAPAPSWSVNLSNISFSVRRSSTGIRNYSVRSSTDGFSTNIYASVGTNTNLTTISGNIFFWKFDNTSTSGDQKDNYLTLVFLPAFSTFTNPITFRFYAWNAEGSGGTFSIDSVQFSGYAFDPGNAVGLSETQGQEKMITVFPNPVLGSPAIINCNSNIEELEIRNLTGQVIHTQKEVNAGPCLLPELSPGIYLIRVRAGLKWFEERLVVGVN